jgi:hypothetical protein
LGRLQNYEGSKGQARITVTPQAGKVVSASYMAKALFEHGEANIEIGLIKHGDQWQIVRFKVDSPALAPR